MPVARSTSSRANSVERVRSAIGDDLTDKVVAVLGLSFKPETDDMRESAAIPLVEALVEDGTRVRAYDPVAMDNARQLLPSGVEYCEDSYDAIDGADAMIIVTEWNQFRSLEICATCTTRSGCATRVSSTSA